MWRAYLEDLLNERDDFSNGIPPGIVAGAHEWHDQQDDGGIIRNRQHIQDRDCVIARVLPEFIRVEVLNDFEFMGIELFP